MSTSATQIEPSLDISLDKQQPDQTMALTQFVEQFGSSLTQAFNHTHPPVYTGDINQQRQAVMDSLSRKPFPAQAEAVQAISALLLDKQEPAAILNAEMGTGKVRRFGA